MKVALTAALLLLSGCLVSSSAQDGAALYRSKCLACHEATGAGKAVLKGTNLLADAVRNASDAELTEAIARGGKNKRSSHAFETKGVKPDEIQMLVRHIRELQSKKKP